MAHDITWGYLKFLTSWFLKTIVTGDGDGDGDEKTPDWFLRLAKRYIEQARRISSRSCAIRSKAKFNRHQCDYLAEKLRLAVQSAHFLQINREYFVREPENMENRLEMFKLLLALSQNVENFIQDCCKDNWIQAVVLSSNVSGHISSLGFHLELCTILFQFWRRRAGLRNSLTLTEVDNLFELDGFHKPGAFGIQELERSSFGFHLDLCIVPFNERRKRSARSFTLTEVDGIFNTEAQTVKEQASLDMKTLLTDLGAVCETREESDIEFQMAALMLEKLKGSGLMATDDSPDQSNSTLLSKRVFSSVEKKTSLGKGSAATVYKATWHGSDVAMKVFEGPDNRDFQNEVSVLVGLSHPNIISVYCSTASNRTCSIVMELMDKDLYTLMQDRVGDSSKDDHRTPFDIMEAVDIMLQIGGGMSYLHEFRIVHRDLKSANILVRSMRTSKNLEYVVAKVADFGLSKVKEKSTTFTMQTVNLGTTGWMAPEMLKSQEGGSQNLDSDKERAKEREDGREMMINYPFKSDIYSFGMVCYEILTGHQPFFQIHSTYEVKSNVLKGKRPDLPYQCPRQLKRLIKQCWNSDAEQRPSFGHICAELRHLKCALLMKSVLGQALPSLNKRLPLSARHGNDGEEAADENREEQPPSLSSITRSLDSNWRDTTAFDQRGIVGTVQPADNIHMSSKKWVIGIDLGTTRVGFAYCYGSHLDQKCTVHYNYPFRSVREKPHCKTLTALYYKQVAGLGEWQCSSWGFLARSKFLADQKLRSKSMTGQKQRSSSPLGDRKMLDVPQGYYVQNLIGFLRNDMEDPSVTISLPDHLTVDTIITDYLRHIGEHALERIKNHSDKKSFAKDSVEWSVTVPSVWEVNAEQKIEECMVEAKLVSRERRTKAVRVFLESEAASFHCHRVLSQTQKDAFLHVNDKILVVDIEGGTVDVVLQEVIGSGSNFKVRVFMESSRGHCGGTSIDESFINFVCEKVTCLERFLKSDDQSYRLDLLSRWEEIKCAFGEHELMSESETMDIGTSLAAKWETFEKENGYPQRETYSEIELDEHDLKSIFDPNVEDILGLIAVQRNRVRDIKAMFVVGGFADSPYLMHRIRSQFSCKVGQIFRPHDPGSAMMEGAIALTLTLDAAVNGHTGVEADF